MSGSHEGTRRLRSGLSLIELLCVVAIIAVLLSLIVPVRRGSGEASMHAGCRRNLHNIFLALQRYEAEHGVFPPPFTVDEYGKRLHSWRTLILPWLGESELYEQIDLTKPWDDPANLNFHEKCPAVFQCPAANPGTDETTYLALTGPDRAFCPGRSRAASEFTDGLSVTAMLVDVSQDQTVSWMSPVDFDGDFESEVKSGHSYGTMVVTGDGAVRQVSGRDATEALRAAASIAGGEDMTDLLD